MRWKEYRIDSRDTGGECELIIDIQADQPLAETGRRLDELADRDSVEQLVCGDQAETFRDILETVVPVDHRRIGFERHSLDAT
ncbi:hypothetical protein D3C87_2046420 [compost metagenome]